MKLTDRYPGSDDPFEGDRTLVLRSLPVGARVTKAVVTLTPLPRPGGSAPTVGVIFDDQTGVGGWGATRTPAALAGATQSAIADLHARRTVSAIVAAREAAVGTPAESGRVTVQIDIGGIWIGLASDGTILSSDKQPLILTLPAKPAAGSPAATALPLLTTAKIKLTAASNSEGDPSSVGSVSLYGLTISTLPTNISARVGQMPPFWVRLGELSAVDTSPDFAAILNAFLLDAPVENGFYAIPFVIHSDTITRLDIELTIDFVVEQPILPPHLPEVVLPYGYSTLPGADEAVTTALLPRDAIPLQASALVRGEFAPTRIARGPIGEETVAVAVVAAPECSLAQPLLSDMEIALTGVDLPLANTTPGLAGMYFAIQADNDGKPSGEILTSADVRVDKPLPGQSSWGSATLPAPFRIMLGVRYWLVLQSRIGQAYWKATPAASGVLALQCSRDNGLSWRTATAPGAVEPLAALFRLRDTPERFVVPVQLQVGKGPGSVPRRLDEFAPLARVDFSFDFAAQLAEHLGRVAAAAPCGRGELLTNGDFSQPPDDDASLRVFGFDARRVMDDSSPAVLEGVVNLDRGVDLSVQRFIALSIKNEASDDEGPKTKPRRIDCAGADPAQTRPDEIVAAINRAMGAGIATYDRMVIIEAPTQPTGEETSVVTLHRWCKPEVPAGWQSLAGRVVRVRQGERVRAVLAAPSSLLADLLGLACVDQEPTQTQFDPADLAQRVAVVGGCAYLLRIRYQTLSFGDDDRTLVPARWQISWLDGEGRLLGGEGAPLTDDFQSEREIPLHEARLVAPESATAAELRFIQPEGILALEEVSLASTLEALRNPLFRFWGPPAIKGGTALPLGWSVRSGWVDRQPQGALLRGIGPDDGLLPADTVLAQSFAVRAGERYELRVRARPRSPTPGDPAALTIERRARLELRWVGGLATALPTIVLLDGRDFPTHAWAGLAPAGATQAEVRLIQPREQGDLLVESLSLTQTDRALVPLIFLAEAPGELTVSKLRVTYDLPATSPEPGVSALELAAARVAMRPVAAPKVLLPAAIAPRALLASSPIELVAGVGEQMLAILAGLPAPITMIAELAALDPESDIPGISRERRLELKSTAEMIIDLDIGAALFSALAGESLEKLLFLPPDELAKRSSQTNAQAEQLQRQLRALRRLTKNERFRGLLLADLMPDAT